ncbi:leucine--tRNA ligase [Candidatus Woesebacteria bacterium RIFCSPHIGHO2_01_FULL_38_9]|uniref:Leucine--tRNA ligase n=1 Tax=Candidatus Woesebacteria bacterium RIFCSPHIGHO2_01_FULL_38_9 TaxID=1802492 RepID=A0A1F7Y0K5_9BACT|nr:MAG: leucine--tRNA ligase [Candidatus Woesebacteria bacterium RIFCSPHIGHO2_01_FULL_38_9]
MEPKWQKIWDDKSIYKSEDFSSSKKFYLLVEFPYPSGAGLHVGHIRSWGAMDAYVRKKRMEGYNVLYPMGWDAFGLPAENYAIKTGIHPSKTVPENIAVFKKQCKSLGLSFDWEREINTTDPKYYKWTQWIFIQLYKEGLAYQAEVPVNWCPKCKTNLADEEVLADGSHERCGTQIEKRMQKQWLLKITKYADRLLEDLNLVDYSPKIRIQQENWIGKSVGLSINFKVEGLTKPLTVWTKFWETVFGATFIVASPEYAKENLLKLIPQKYTKEVTKYINISLSKSEKERGENKEKSGVLTGISATNPVNNEKIPIFVADYVLGNVGTGAVMGVPSHDERDFAFAKKFGLKMMQVVSYTDKDIDKKVAKGQISYEGEGKLVNSGRFNGLDAWGKGKEKMAIWMIKEGFTNWQTNYHLRDWIFSRQHYWGEPIPIIHCPKCGTVVVPDDELPIELPYVERYEPSGTGESPLAKVESWVNTTCPQCGGPARRETDTMPNWAGSNWYFIRYLDTKNDKELADKEKIKYWLPIDFYQGGFEHTTLHLLYSRFIYKFLFDIDVVLNPEPYMKRRSHGIVLGEDGRKMSKSFGNVINPDQIVEKFGADGLRMYEMFMGPFENVVAWSGESLEGCYRFLKRLWRSFNENVSRDKPTSDTLNLKLHQTIKKVSNDLENLKFNTAISALMELLNVWEKEQTMSFREAKLLVQLLAPFAPHMAEELWVEVLNQKFSVHKSSWPAYDVKLTKEANVTIAIQVNGKLRGTLTVVADEASDKDKVVSQASNLQNVAKWLEDKEIKDTVFVAGRLVNFVIG